MNAKKAAALIRITADSKGVDRGVAEAKKKMRGMGADLKKIGGKIWGGGKSAISKVADGFGIQIAGGITDTVQSIRGFEKSLVRLQVASGKTPGEMNAIRDSITEVSRATALSREEILEGTQSYIDLTGDVNGAAGAMSSFSRIAQASGASVSDVASAAAAFKEAGVPIEDMEERFGGLIAQGKAGAVSLKDFARELSAILPRWAKFNEGATDTGLAQMGAAFQVARKGFGNASEAATGMEALMGAITLNAKKFEAAGVKVFDKNPKTGVKTMRSFDSIIKSIGDSKLMKDPTALTKAMGSKEAEQTFTMLNRNLGVYEELIDAGKQRGVVEKDLATVMQSDAYKLETAINNVKLAIVEAFTPERIAAFVEIVEQVASAIGWVIDGLGELKDGLTNKGVNPYAAARARDELEESDRSPSLLDGVLGMGALSADKGVSNAVSYAIAGASAGGVQANAANEAAFDVGQASIRQAARKDRNRRAVELSMGAELDPLLYRQPGTEGRQMAGSEYLREQGVSQDEQVRIRKELTDARDVKNNLAAMDKAGSDAIAAAIRDGFKGIAIQMDGSRVDKAVSNAPSQNAPRRR